MKAFYPKQDNSGENTEVKPKITEEEKYGSKLRNYSQTPISKQSFLPDTPLLGATHQTRQSMMPYSSTMTKKKDRNQSPL